MKITRDTVKQYGKYVAPLAVGAGLGLGGATYADSGPTQNDYQNLNQTLQETQAENADLQEQVEDLQTTVTDKEDRVQNLRDQVTQFNNTVEQLRADNENLDELLADAQARTALVDYLPVFSDEDVEFEGDIGVTVDEEVNGGEGDYDSLTANYTSDDGEYDVTVTEYEEGEDAEDAVEDFRETQTPVEFSADGDTHTVELSGYTGELTGFYLEFDDYDAVEDVDHEDDIESVVVDGEDVTDRVESVTSDSGNTYQLQIEFEDGYYVNEGQKVSVTYSDATDEGDLERVYVNGDSFDYDQDDDTREDIYRDGDTVVEIVGTDNGDEFEAQYNDLQSQYE